MRKSSFLPTLALVTGSTLFGLALSECALRIALPPPIAWRWPQEFYEFDPLVGHTLRPNQQAFTHDKEVETNSLGLRDHEYGAFPREGVVRFLAMGDSQTFRNGLDAASTWPKQLEKRLAERRGGPAAEVLNGGIPGTDTWQHAQLTLRFVDAYHPRVVLLALYPNDVTPRHTPVRSSSAALTNTRAQRLVYLAKQSSLLLSLQVTVRTVRALLDPPASVRIERSILTGEPDPRVEAGWAEVMSSLEAMKAHCIREDIRMVVLILPRRDQVDGRLPVRQFNERAQALIEELGLESLDVLPVLQRSFGEHGDSLFIPWDGHNGESANSAIADALAAFLVETGLLETSQPLPGAPAPPPDGSGGR